MKLALVGDIALFGRFSLDGGRDARRYFARVAEYLGAFDHVVGNLETPFAAGMRPRGAKSAYIAAAPGDVALLKALNIDIVNVANNHIFDYGLDGYRATLELLDRHAIQWFGAEQREVVLHQGGASVALHGYCSYNTNPLGVSRRGGPGVNALEIPRVEERLRAHAAAGRLNIVSVHSGQEHVNFPSRDDIRMARRFAAICPYVYYGHHPHVAQGVEVRGQSVIAYSLGNFCFDDVYTSKSDQPLIRQSGNNREGLVLELDVQGESVVDHRLISLESSEHELIVGGAEILEKVRQYSAALEEEPALYDRRREALISEYIASRKQLRDLKWYATRLNLNSAMMLAKARLNRNHYEKAVSRHLDAE